MLATRFSSRNSNTLQSAYPLSDDQIRSVAPSIFASAAHESRSARYTYVPTIDVLAGLRREGFEPFMVTQARSRDEGRREYTRHMLRLRHASQVAKAETPEVILVNSHDGTSAYQMLAGMFRFVCKNGMVVSAGTVDEIRVPHKGDIVGQVIEGAFSVVKEFDRVQESAGVMKAITLNSGEQQVFARSALIAKYGEPETGAFPITEAQALEARRVADAGNDLWTTFNRVQENLVRGGLAYRTANNRRNSTRAVRGISENVQLNRALWTLADSMAKLKVAA